MRTPVIGVALISIACFALCPPGPLAADPVQVSFPGYFPLDPSVHCVKTFRVTVNADDPGQVGKECTSEIDGDRVVPYLSGDIAGRIATSNCGDGDGVAVNDGTTVKLLAGSEEGTYGYLSTDDQVHEVGGECKLTSHPSSWSFGVLTDGELIDQRSSFFVVSDLDPPCEVAAAYPFDQQLLLMDIQDVTVQGEHHANAVVFWYLDTEYGFSTLDPELSTRIAFSDGLPAGTETTYSVTAFDIYGNAVGLVAEGDIDAATGALRSLSELVGRDCPWASAATVEISRYGTSSQGASRLFGSVAVVMIPLGALLFLRVLRRKA